MGSNLMAPSGPTPFLVRVLGKVGTILAELMDVAHLGRCEEMT